MMESSVDNNNNNHLANTAISLEVVAMFMAAMDVLVTQMMTATISLTTTTTTTSTTLGSNVLQKTRVISTYFFLWWRIVLHFYVCV
jgi:hypothetical protein